MNIEPMSSEWQLKRIADTLDKILKVVVVTMSKEEQKKVIEILKTPTVDNNSISVIPKNMDTKTTEKYKKAIEQEDWYTIEKIQKEQKLSIKSK